MTYMSLHSGSDRNDEQTMLSVIPQENYIHLTF